METEKIKKILFNEITFGLAVASCVFWLMNYVNSPLTKVQLDIELMKKDIQIITEAHLQYNDNANKRDEAIIQMQIDIAEIKGLLKQ